MNPISKNLIDTYIKAKDSNKPHLTKKVFAKDAVLKMIVHSDNITFPPKVEGLENITKTLISDFSIKFENVYTLCFNDTLKETNNSLSCKWLVVMNDKESKEIKVGHGLYLWTFENELVSSLEINIKEMNILNSSYLEEIMRCIDSLSYPWCKNKEFFEKINKVESLKTSLKNMNL